ncbi:MAG TPA: TIGR03067 domain-containing protein [Myxococcota bacterium]|nr:TIGR03067 domain-containing protein [Myxococcota bacterium]
MNRRSRRNGWVAALLLAACVAHPYRDQYLPDPTTDALEGDYQRLQGQWVVVYNELKGIDLAEMHGAVWTIQGRMMGGERFILDQTSQPKRIDSDDGRSARVLGIYQLDGDQLTVCTGDSGEARPTEFKTSAFSGAILTRFVRKR